MDQWKQSGFIVTTFRSPLGGMFIGFRISKRGETLYYNDQVLMDYGEEHGTRASKIIKGLKQGRKIA